MNLIYIIIAIAFYVFKMYSDAKKKEEEQRKKRQVNTVPTMQPYKSKPVLPSQPLPPVAVEDPFEKMIRELKETYVEEKLPSEEVKENEFEAPVYENLDERFQQLKLDNIPTEEGGSIFNDKDWIDEPMHKKVLVSSLVEPDYSKKPIFLNGKEISPKDLIIAKIILDKPLGLS
ncbi:MAG: hypothetical protein K1X55_03885 [Chitinophagales bacterium]|nr:hypothetical protein [Chitinophagales bacterium]